MESINFLKGYGKVNPVEQQPPHPPRHARKSVLITAAISAVLLLTLILGVLLGAVIHESAEDVSLSSNSAESIRAVCGVTQYPESCRSSLNPFNSSIRPDPESIFKLSLGISAKELNNASLFVKQLKETSNDVHSSGPLGDYETQLEDAMNRLNDSVAAMEAAPGEKVLTDAKISDIQTWVSAAMTDQETCLDGLEEMGSAALDVVRAKLQMSKELMSNCLAIVAHMKDLLDKFEMGMH